MRKFIFLRKDGKYMPIINTLNEVVGYFPLPLGIAAFVLLIVIVFLIVRFAAKRRK